MSEYREILKYFIVNNECLASGDKCVNCPIAETCNTPTDVQDAQEWLNRGNK